MEKQLSLVFCWQVIEILFRQTQSRNIYSYALEERKGINTKMKSKPLSHQKELE